MRVVVRMGSVLVCRKHVKPKASRIPIRYHNRSRGALPLMEMAAYLADITRDEVQFVQVKVDIPVHNLFHTKCYTTEAFSPTNLLEQVVTAPCPACGACGEEYTFGALLAR